MEEPILTEEEKMWYINHFDILIKRLAKKFSYYTCLDKKDLWQEGYYRILTILDKMEEGKMDQLSLLKYINRSILNHFLNLVRDYPSYRIVETSVEFISEGDLECLGTVEEELCELLLADILTEEENNIVMMLFCGFRQEEIMKELGYKSQGTISKHLKKIRRKVDDLYEE